jgi:hypothetical protein
MNLHLSKEQQETYNNLVKMIELKGKPYVLGWAMGTIIRLAKHDPQLRRQIRDQLDKS